jgi:hypothetical protein
MDDKQESLTAKSITFCSCGGDRIDPGLLLRFEEHLGGLSARVIKLSDPGGLAASHNTPLADLLNGSLESLVIGCYACTMSLLIDQMRDQSDHRAFFNYINLVELSYENVISQVMSIYSNFIRGDRRCRRKFIVNMG